VESVSEGGGGQAAEHSLPKQLTVGSFRR
jgi:hypothetical protein